jgi:hypothetical protein
LAQSTRFGRNGAVERDVAGGGKRRLRFADKRNERVAHPLQRRQQSQNLLRLAAGGERNDHVAFGDHAKIAMDRFSGMHKQSRATGRAERSGDLLRDDAALAHPGHDDATTRLATVENARHRTLKVRSHRAIEPLSERQQRVRFDADQLGRFVKFAHGSEIMALKEWL